MQRDTKQEMLTVGYELALKHGLGHLTNKVMTEATGFYYNALYTHFGGITQLREAVLAHGVVNGTMKANAVVRCPRLTPAERKVELLEQAYAQAVEKGLGSVSRRSVAEALGVTDGLVSRYFGTLQGLREAVLAKAVVTEQFDIIADALELQMNTHHIPPDLVSQARKILAA